MRNHVKILGSCFICILICLPLYGTNDLFRIPEDKLSKFNEERIITFQKEFEERYFYLDVIIEKNKPQRLFSIIENLQNSREILSTIDEIKSVNAKCHILYWHFWWAKFEHHLCSEKVSKSEYKLQVTEGRFKNSLVNIYHDPQTKLLRFKVKALSSYGYSSLETLVIRAFSTHMIRRIKAFD